ncbi:MAG: helix-turn-helix transcriptional regulator [Gemmiger sp.]|nr:helix-turn-helix transcriptional regulator [Gemmiger sp.]
MEKIDNEQFGKFLMQLRKGKGLTQKQLAEKLYISDKAVSKWERGLSLPDIALLMPLAQLLGVTTTELLSGKRIESGAQLSVNEVEALVAKTIVSSKAERHRQGNAARNRVVLFCLCCALCAAEGAFYVWRGHPLGALPENVVLVELLMLIFGTYFTFFAQETLPVYYDENKISFYTHGPFRINIPGVPINNSNWGPIRQAVCGATMAVMALFPLLYLVLLYAAPALWAKWELAFTLGAVCSIFIPLYWVGRKYA